jgi:hypothetical protein
VHQRHQLGHLRHLHLPGGEEADGPADDQRADDPRDAGGGDARAEHRGQHGDRHADDAEQVAAARRLGVGQATQAEDEEDGGADVGDGGEAGSHVRGSLSFLFTCGTWPACAA